MQGKEEHSEAEENIDRDENVQGVESSEEDVKDLYFTEITLRIQRSTYDKLYEVKQMVGCSTDRIISFFLDAGAVMYSAMKEEIVKELLKKVPEK